MATADGQKKWAAFYVTAKKPDDKPAVKPADNKKPDAGPIIENGFLPPLKSLNLLASAFAPKDQQKKVATGSRRLQAPQTGPATVAITANGVNLSTVQDNFPVPGDDEFAGSEGQESMSGNLLKFASALVLSFLVFLN